LSRFTSKKYIVVRGVSSRRFYIILVSRIGGSNRLSINRIKRSDCGLIGWNTCLSRIASLIRKSSSMGRKSRSTERSTTSGLQSIVKHSKCLLSRFLPADRSLTYCCFWRMCSNGAAVTR